MSKTVPNALILRSDISRQAAGTRGVVLKERRPLGSIPNRPSTMARQ
jgi:hypothetical protein